MKPLRPCPACSRHVRVTETSCTFCGEALETVTLPKVAPPARLGRAALLAFGAAAATATIAACTSGTGPIVADASVDDGGSDAQVPETGGQDTGSIAKPYGAPPADGLLDVV